MWPAARDRALAGSQVTARDACLHGGPWDLVGIGGRGGGRAYASAMACLVLVIDDHFITIKPK